MNLQEMKERAAFCQDRCEYSIAQAVRFQRVQTWLSLGTAFLWMFNYCVAVRDGAYGTAVCHVFTAVAASTAIWIGLQSAIEGARTFKKFWAEERDMTNQIIKLMHGYEDEG